MVAQFENIYFQRKLFTFSDFFLLAVFFSYISILRLTANILYSKFVVQSLSDLLALELILKMEDICELASPGPLWDIVLKERREIEI